MEENGNDVQKVMFTSLVFPSSRMCYGKKSAGYRAGSVFHYDLLSCYHFYLLPSKFTYWIRLVFSNAITRAGRPRARERKSQTRVWHDDHGVVRPLQPRAKQHRDATTAQRGLEELDQQAATRGQSDGKEMSEPCRLGDCAVVLVIYTEDILRFTIVAFWIGGVVVGGEKIYFAIYSVCNYSLVRRQGWNVRIPSIPLRVECNIRFWLSSA